MPEDDTTVPTLGAYAHEIRSKNAGPFWVTMEAFMKDEAGYAIASELITQARVAELYGVDADAVMIFRIPTLNVVKVSYPRPVPQASLRDRDIHAGQHHVPLASLLVNGAHGHD